LARILLILCLRPGCIQYHHSRLQEGAIRKFTVNLLGAAALAAAGIALLRQGNQRLEPAEVKVDEVPPGETIPGRIRLEKLRELGI
jgi:hypothetical protein